MTTMTLPSTVRHLKDLPSPPGLPLLGNLLQIQPTSLHRQMERWAAELGSPYVIRLARERCVIITDHDVAQAVSRERPERFRRSSRLQPVLAEMGGNGLFSAEGAAWKPQRMLIMQALAATHFRGFYPTLHAITDRLRRRWVRAAQTGAIVEMDRDLMRYTVDVTCALAFGQDPNTLETDGDVIQNHLALIFPMIMSRIVAPVPYWRFFKLPRDRALDRALKVVHAYVRQMMERARQAMRESPTDTPRNVLEAMLAVRDQPDSVLTDDDVAANVLTLLLAGEDTTAHTLAWTMEFLAPDHARQTVLHEQARRQFGDELVCPSYEDLRHLDLFEAMSTEAGRLRPVAPINSYEPLEDTVVGDVFVPKGTRIFFINRPAMLNDRHFGEARRWEPERWVRDRHAAARDGGGEASAHEPRAYMQFGAGSRVCPGRHLAGVEIRLVLSMLMRSFKIELACPPEEIEEVLAFAMTPSKMPVRMRLRG